MARTKPERPPPQRRTVRFQPPPAEQLACGDPRTYDDREITFAACGTRVCDQHPTFQHFCRIRKHRNPGHTPDP